MGRVNGMGCRVAGCMRWERDGRTDSRRRTCVAPESPRIGDGTMKHKRAWNIRGQGGKAVVRFVVVGIVRFQRSKWIKVGEMGMRRWGKP